MRHCVARDKLDLLGINSHGLIFEWVSVIKLAVNETSVLGPLFAKCLFKNESSLSGISDGLLCGNLDDRDLGTQKVSKKLTLNCFNYLRTPKLWGISKEKASLSTNCEVRHWKQWRAYFCFTEELFHPSLTKWNVSESSSDTLTHFACGGAEKLDGNLKIEFSNRKLHSHYICTVVVCMRMGERTFRREENSFVESQNFTNTDSTEKNSWMESKMFYR